MRPDLRILEFAVAVLLLLGIGVVPLVAEVPGPSVADRCGDACPDDSGCDGDDSRCGCCARVAPAVVPAVAAAADPPRVQAPSAGDPAAAEPSVVDRLLDPPRLPVS